MPSVFNYKTHIKPINLTAKNKSYFITIIFKNFDKQKCVTSITDLKLWNQTQNHTP